MKKSSKKIYILFIILNLILLPVSVIGENNIHPVVERIGGDNRILTSIRLSEEIFKTSDTVILVGYNGEIDALGGTLLASKENAPIIMTNRDNLTNDVKLELERLKAKDIIILGGEESISKNVVNSLRGYNVERIDGTDRVETSINIAKRSTGKDVDEVFLSLGYDVYADALAIGPITARLDIPLLLSNKDSISPKTLEAIKDLNVRKVTIIGGASVVSKSVENELKSMGLVVDRIYGSNREATSVKIAEKYIKDPSEVIMANGYVFPDSVLGGYYANKKNGPIILTKKDKLIDSTQKYVSKSKKDITLLGLYGAVDQRVETDLNIILKTDDFKNKFFLLPQKGDYDKEEAGMMIDRMMNIDFKTIGNIYHAGVRMKLSNRPITDESEYSYLKGVIPRGWEGLGKTWDDVPGAGGGGGITPIARIGYSEPGDKSGHNSINLELHELAHTIDNYRNGYRLEQQLSNSKEFIYAWNEEVHNILPQNYYINYREEYFAEIFAMYYLDKRTNSYLMEKAPKTYKFVENIALLKGNISK